MDRNQLIGAVIISLGIIGYFKFFGPKKQTKEKNTIEQVNSNQKLSSEPVITSNVTPPTTFPAKKYGLFSNFIDGVDEDITLENDNIKIILSSKGAKIKNVTLKKYKDYYGNHLNMLDESSSNMGFKFLHNDMSISTSDLYFKPTITKNKVSFIIKIDENKYIKQNYLLKKDKYEIDYEVEFIGLDKDILGNKLDFIWNNKLKPLEKDLTKSRDKATINYYLQNNKFKSLKIKQKDKVEENIISPIKWISFKQRFFTSALIASSPLRNAHLSTIPTQTNDKIVKTSLIKLGINLVDLKDKRGRFTFFFGPNKYKILKTTTPGFTNNLFLGWPVVKWINKFFTTPIFNFLEKYFSNYGIIIILLVLIIKLLLFPLSYKSQISMAKMKVVKPELDALKAKYKNDAKKLQVEQMNLYREMGINPLGGCIPVLLQMPMFIAMFNFFPNAIEIRQASFLWASDLSTFDSIATLPFTIPMYGNHVSLFTLLMTISTIISSWSNSQMSNSSSDSSMKMFSYVMPIMFMFILNSFPAALGLYYFTSNVFTFLQQLILKRFINEKELKKKLEENKNTTSSQPKKTRSQSRLEKILSSKKKKK